MFQSSGSFFSSSFPISHIVLVEFQSSSYTVVEGQGMVRFTIVKRTHSSKDVIVQFTTQDGSATCKFLLCYLDYIKIPIIPYLLIKPFINVNVYIYY